MNCMTCAYICTCILGDLIGNWIISAYLIISVSFFKPHAQLQVFVLELKRFSNYAKDISEILELIQLISFYLRAS